MRETTDPDRFATALLAIQVNLQLPDISREELSELCVQLRKNPSNFLAFTIAMEIPKLLAKNKQREIHPSDSIDIATLTTAPYVDYVTTDGEMADQFSALRLEGVRGRVFARSELSTMLAEIRAKVR